MSDLTFSDGRLRPSAAAAFIGLMALVLFWGLFTFVVVSQRAQEEARTVEEGDRLTRALEAYANSVFGEVLRSTLIVRAVTADGETPDWLYTDEYQRILARVIRDNAVNAQILVFDRDGRPVNLDPDVEPSSIDFAYFSGFAEHQRSPSMEPVIRTVTTNPINTRQMIPVTQRLQLADGSFAGVVVVGLDVERLSALFEAVRYGSQGSVNLVRTDGLILVRAPYVEEYVGKSYPESGLIQQFKAGVTEGSVLAKNSPSYGDRLVIYRQVGELPLLVAIARSPEGIFTRWWSSVRALVLGSVALTLAMILLTALLVSQLIRGERSSAALHRAIQEAEAANQAKSEFLARISHELRTPLNAINGFAEMIEHQTLGEDAGPEYREYAKLIRQSGTHLLSLVNDVLDLSRIEAGRRVLEREHLSIRESIDFCVKMVQSDASAKNLAVMKVLPETDPPFEGDKLALRQVLLNLMSNAVKYTRPNGRITVAVKVAPRQMVIQVTDTGIGMDDATLKSTTEAFGGTSAWVRPQEQGTGLGLPISRSLTELMGGSFTIETEAGVGTTVTLTFPLPKDSESA